VDAAGRVPDSEAVTEGLGATDRVKEEVLVELGVSEGVSDPVGLSVTDRVEEGLGLTDSEGVWDCVLEGEGGTRSYERA
jgi:hypothetical protein